MHGWLPCYKPSGISCVQLARKVKKLAQQKKIGHIGTLDPMAEGVLTLALGEATKIIPYLHIGHKTYEFQVAWGEERNTDDAFGEITKQTDVTPSSEDIKNHIELFTGNITQKPPKYSAIHINGVRSYKLACKGLEYDMPERSVYIKNFHMVNHNTFTVTCSTGTYIRSLARDLAHKLGTYAHLTFLKRTHDGLFQLQPNFWREGNDIELTPLTAPLSHLTSINLREDDLEKFRRGMDVQCDATTDQPHAIVMHQNKFIGIGEIKDNRTHPRRLLHLP